MFYEKEIKGNSLIYCLFQICNIALAVLGLFTITIAVYLIVLSKSLNTFNSLFFIFGVILVILSYFGCKLRTSLTGNLVYLFSLTIIFLFYMLLVIMLYLYRNEMIDWVMSTYDANSESTAQVKSVVNKNIGIATDLLLLVLILLVNKQSLLILILVFSCCF